jgi:uncharacterized membrane protein
MPPRSQDSAAVDTRSRDAVGGPRAPLGAATRWLRSAEHLAVLALGLLVLVVHDVGYLLSQPFWTDEAWVAVTTRFPLSQLAATTSSTPIGWSFLLRLVTVRGEQTGRLLPLAFAGAAVVIAYWLGRGLGWRRPGAAPAAGALAAVAVLLLPAMLVRDDMKQYTADACAALLTLAMISRLERQWSRRALGALAATVVVGMLFSDAAAFAGTAAFVAISVVELARRSWRRLAEAAVTGAVTAVLMVGIYEGFYARAVVPGLTAYWKGFYLPVGKGLHADITFLGSRFGAVGGYVGLGPAWLALPLVAAGLVTIFRLGRPAVAVAAAVLWPEMLALSATQKYPFLDLRTSTFLFAITAVVAAIGIAGVCTLLWPRLRGALSAGLVVVAVAAFVVGAEPYVRSHLIPREDVRDQARYVLAHARPGDVILVNMSSSWSFGYYWPRGQPSRQPDSVVLQGYVAYFHGQPDIVVARNRDVGGIAAALALARAREGSCGRIWLIRSHMVPSEVAAWRAVLSQQRLAAWAVGRDGLRVILASGPACR